MKNFLYLLSISLIFSSCNSSVEEVENTSPICSVTEAQHIDIDSINHYEINIVYPVIDANTSYEILNKINNTISQTFYEKSFQKDFIASHTDLPENLTNKNSEWYGQLQNTYGVTQCDTVISIWFNIYQYYLGAAHGYSTSYSQQFNLNTGELIPINSFFKTDNASLQIIKGIINSQVQDSVCWGIETDSNILNYLENFSLSSDSITIKLDDYALCPYAFGLNSITISRDEFSKVLIHPKNLNCQDIIAVQDEGEIASH